MKCTTDVLTLKFWTNLFSSLLQDCEWPASFIFRRLHPLYQADSGHS